METPNQGRQVPTFLEAINSCTHADKKRRGTKEVHALLFCVALLPLSFFFLLIKEYQKENKYQTKINQV